MECKNYEIIVVDNNSNDGSVQMIKSDFPEVILISNKENIGFARANNQGIEIACGEYILFLNPDTIIVQDSIDILLKVIAENKCGLVGPKIILPDNSIQITCARKSPSLKNSFLFDAIRINKLPFIGSKIISKNVYPYDYEKSQIVEAISGAAMLGNTDIIKLIGGFGEEFIHTGEDLDLCYRIIKAGYNIFYVAESKIVHLLGQSSKKARVKTEINSAISVEYYFRRNKSPFCGFLYKMIVILVETPITIIIGILKLSLKKISIEEMVDRIKIFRGVIMWKKVY
jgi:GT2 family glycosyltransferase